MKSILVVYHSQEKGNTRRMAELVAEGCRQVHGVAVEMVDVNERRVDMAKAEKADGFALGSPDYFSYVAGGLKQFFDDLKIAEWAKKNVINKPYVGFLTHGGGGKALESLEKLAGSCKLNKVADTAVCKGSPQEPSDVDKCRQLGKALAQHVAQAS